jgi:hypothetical protein
MANEEVAKLRNLEEESLDGNNGEFIANALEAGEEAMGRNERDGDIDEVAVALEDGNGIPVGNSMTIGEDGGIRAATVVYVEDSKDFANGVRAAIGKESLPDGAKYFVSGFTAYPDAEITEELKQAYRDDLAGREDDRIPNKADYIFGINLATETLPEIQRRENSPFGSVPDGIELHEEICVPSDEGYQQELYKLGVPGIGPSDTQDSTNYEEN